MKMIKLSEDHYIVMDDSEIKEGDWIYNAEREPSILKCVGKGSLRGWQKITDSTQPLELDIKSGEYWYWKNIEQLSLSEVKELFGVVDKAFERYPIIENDKDHNDRNYYRRSAYYQALEDNKEKKYTEEDLMKFYKYVKTHTVTEALRHIQPKTEWEVEFVDGKLKLKL